MLVFLILLDFLNSDNNKSDLLLSFEKAIDMEQIVYKSLLNLHKCADENNDPQFTDFLEGEYLEEQVNAINELTKYASQLERIGNNGHGIWNFDKEFSS